MSLNKATKAAVLAVFASAARTATPTAVTLTKAILGVDPDRMLNMHLIIDVTAIVTTPIITVTIDALDPVSGKYYNLLTSSAISTVSVNILKIGVDMENAANLAARDILPEDVRISIAHTDADSITYSVGLNFQYE